QQGLRLPPQAEDRQHVLLPRGPDPPRADGHRALPGRTRGLAPVTDRSHPSHPPAAPSHPAKREAGGPPLSATISRFETAENAATWEQPRWLDTSSPAPFRTSTGSSTWATWWGPCSRRTCTPGTSASAATTSCTSAPRTSTAPPPSWPRRRPG